MSPGLTQAEVDYAARACVTAVDVGAPNGRRPRCGLTPPSARGRGGLALAGLGYAPSRASKEVIQALTRSGVRHDAAAPTTSVPVA